jgi:hypothetical protein
MLCFYCKNINQRGLTQEQVMNKLIISCYTDVAVCRAFGHVSLSFPQIKGLKIHNTSLYKLHNTSLYKLLTLQSLLTFTLTVIPVCCSQRTKIGIQLLRIKLITEHYKLCDDQNS